MNTIDYAKREASTLLVKKDCFRFPMMLDGASRSLPECNQCNAARYSELVNHHVLFRCRNSFGLLIICTTTWVDLLFVADYKWDESSGGKVLKLKRWMTNHPFLHSRPLDKLAPQPSLNSLSERQVPLTQSGGICSHLPVSWFGELCVWLLQVLDL